MSRLPRIRPLPALLVSLVLVAGLPACGDDDGGLPAAGVDCADLSPEPAMVSDIDETLTVSDAEFLQQVMDPEPARAARWP